MASSREQTRRVSLIHALGQNVKQAAQKDLYLTVPVDPDHG
jgi:hypothetical protein